MCQAAESTREHVSAIGKDGCAAEETAAAVHVVSRRTEQDRLALAESHRSLRQGTAEESVMNVVGSMVDSGKTARRSEESVCAGWTEPLRKKLPLEKKRGTTERSQKCGVVQQQF